MRRMRGPGLRGRVALAMVAAVAGACAVLTITASGWAAEQHRQSLEESLIDAVERDMSELADVLARAPEARTLRELSAAGLRSNPMSVASEALLIPLDHSAGPFSPIDPAGAMQWVFLSDVEPLRESHPECLYTAGPGVHDTPDSSVYRTESCGPYLMAFGSTQPGSDEELGGPWVVVRAIYLPDQEDPFAGYRTILWMLSAGIVVLATALAFGVAGSVIRPMRRAGEMANAVAAGDLSVRMPVRGKDDVAAMSQAVNTMADRLTGQIADLERANETQRRFVSDVAHELRTPTTALLASAEALQDPETREEAAALIAPQLGRLATLTEDLLEISRMDAGHTDLVTDRIDLVDLIAEVVAGVDVAYVGPAELLLTTDPVRLRTVVRNLVANAVQHGAPPITVTLARDEATVMIEVHDGGVGVPDDLRDRVFDRFVRGDEARHGASSGLGLAIAAENARLLGGVLALEPDGSTFRLTLPVQGEVPVGEE